MYNVVFGLGLWVRNNNEGERDEITASFYFEKVRKYRI